MMNQMTGKLHRLYEPRGTFVGHILFDRHLEETMERSYQLALPVIDNARINPYAACETTSCFVEKIVFGLGGYNEDGVEGVTLVCGAIEHLDHVRGVCFMPSASYIRSLVRDG